MRFSDVIGQTEVKARLRAAHREGRIAHALLFVGPEGNGATPLALAFAQYIACPNKTEEDSCGACPTCKKISTLQFADLHFTFPFFNKPKKTDTTCDEWMADFRKHLLANPYSSQELWRHVITSDGENKQFHISVNEAGRIVNKLSLRSYEGGYKFHIIWMAQYLKTETANKLLKIIEEPPANTIFMLVATSAEFILPTILSRVQRLNVPKISDDEIALGLVKEGLTPVEASNLAHFVDGNWQRALLLANQPDPNAFFAHQFQELMRSCFQKEMLKLSGWSEAMHALSREDQKSFLHYALDQIRQCLMLNYTGQNLIRMNQQEQAFATKFAKYINDTNAEEMIDVLTEAYNDISRNAYSKLVLMDTSIKLHYLMHRKG